jgi:hypothetical protein
MLKTLHFHFNYAEFSREMGVKVKLLERDLDVFREFGYDEQNVQNLEKLVNGFSNFPTDEELEGDVMIATEKKNQLAEELRDFIKKVMVRVDLVFGNENPHYRKFGANNLSRLTDESLYRAGRRVSRVGVIYLEKLKHTGLHEEELGRLSELAGRFEEALECQRDRSADREIASVERADLANRIYREVSAFCNVGREIWKKTNEARYNDYILYDT